MCGSGGVGRNGYEAPRGTLRNVNLRTEWRERSSGRQRRDNLRGTRRKTTVTRKASEVSRRNYMQVGSLIR